jgi:hypothetical protein
MGYGLSVQEALDHLRKGGIYVRRWSGVDTCEGVWRDNELARRRCGAGFLFWPSSKHRFGWFLEAGYDYSFARGHERSIGKSGGLLIGIPRRR